MGLNQQVQIRKYIKYRKEEITIPQFILCKKHTCPKIETCYRYRAVPDQDQLYNEFINLCNEQDNYRYFITIRDNDKVIDLDIKAIENNEESNNEKEDNNGGNNEKQD